MIVPLLVVDAFAPNAFAGNPAAVALLAAPADPAWMQAVATEMNLSESAFPVRRPDGDFDLRWFTPVAEIDLCGHATLAAAHALWERGVVPSGQTIEFHTASGVLRVGRLADGWIEMDFPIWRFAQVMPRGSRTRGGRVEAGGGPTDVPPGDDSVHAADAMVAALDLARALGVEASEAWRRGDDWLLLVDEAAAVRAASPDLAAVATLARMAIVTAPAAGLGVDFVSRVFLPAIGIPEDPVTGAAHCALAPFWAARLGRDRLVGYQASRRGGTVRVEVRGDRVGIAGQAVTVLRGEIAG